jgi:hypothetical protein
MSYLTKNRRRKRLKWIAILCLLTVGFVLTEEASHLHFKDTASSQRNCPVCNAAHQRTASLPTVAPEVVATPVAVATLHPQEFIPHSHFAPVSLYIRPPPSV